MVVWPQPAKLHVNSQQQHQKVVSVLEGSAVTETEQEHSLSALSFSAVSI